MSKKECRAWNAEAAERHMEGKRNILIKIYAGDAGGSPVFEELPALPLGSDTYELLSSPGLALNMARGDIVRVTTIVEPPQILKRGGNFCIHIYADSVASIQVSDLENRLKVELNGTVDGLMNGNMALTIPSISGIDNIRKFFDDHTSRTGKQWYWSNIYKYPSNVEDDTLLDWWL